MADTDDFDMRDLGILMYEGYEIGDKVVISDKHEYAGRPGERRKIIGFGEIEYGRLVGPAGPRKPGIYTNRAIAALEQWGGDPQMVDATKFRAYDQGKYDRRAQELIAARRRGEEIKPFLRDLPETPFWELDKVRVVSGVYTKDEPWEARVLSIEYLKLDDRVQKGTPWPAYNLDDGSGPCGSADDLELVERGNVWRLYHDEPLVFEDLEEEAGFAFSIGNVEKLKNRRTEKYQWTEDELFLDLRNGSIDDYQSNTEQTIGLRFNDRELGRRVRKAAIKKLTAVAA